MTYVDGDPWVICDRTGMKVRMSQTRKEWNGLRVRKESWEPRHPQDFVKGVPDNQSVPDARPEPADTFLTTNQVTRDSF